MDNHKKSNDNKNKNHGIDIEKSLENNINNFINEIKDIAIDNKEIEKTKSINGKKIMKILKNYWLRWNLCI